MNDNRFVAQSFERKFSGGGFFQFYALFRYFVCFFGSGRAEEAALPPASGPQEDLPSQESGRGRRSAGGQRGSRGRARPGAEGGDHRQTSRGTCRGGSQQERQRAAHRLVRSWQVSLLNNFRIVQVLPTLFYRRRNDVVLYLNYFK